MKKHSALPMSCFEDTYYVPDLIRDPAEIQLVLLLESPYRDEVCHGHPLAGSAGKSVAAFFAEHVPYFRNLDRQVPFGCQILSPSHSRMVLMNSSNYPLDKSVYRHDDYLPHKDIITAWEVIRTNPSSRRRKKLLYRQVEEEMIRDLRKRLEVVPRSALIIPCGMVARALLEKCCAENKRIYSPKVPHPSRNQWQNRNNFGDFADFIRTVNRQLL